ncbi:hypothetical protein BCV72DRAFT_306608 [Rhizopus microsporus var. microsporus]|uniref:Uncharacterized protein n=2 Tax=Rhizopus microsporus TaxID=58291 RepID=A0A2G4SWS0_RHIZD|nr:uncharacterized protein RHIMIDRAFT_237246 [Rhizopus microsporus ATCC 52813]ORE05218.1 hypothetical protein BCV72DRAFT_306608 [Rhizopus microsporus var. microsporus]PHZ13233.1 hypothetical protein RHIMIDRAFT_237246 [Rhizopus microsporus ATCC 52813]
MDNIRIHYNAKLCGWIGTSTGLNFFHLVPLKRYTIATVKERQTLRDFYYGKKINRQRRTLEIKTRTVKDRITSKERQFVLQDSKRFHPVMAIGNQGLGIGRAIKAYERRGSKWLQ